MDYYWQKLSVNGDPAAQECGWVKDQFGVSWQIVPRLLKELISDPDVAKAERVTAAMFRMKKINISELQRAAENSL